ncbi:MAG: 3-deoxy-7-phosphoheptulonate synthase class II [Candidatus Marinimicrobia bacterium]|jgi:3-deoxy-7-phosphoheptulonate synthase|nr:3-deoxy-7-phosphoheptulonate synthase class II [Candidatus Neomarinimicrobiota bacterium]MEC7621813.1 3-deoxy-7-phosphoheptulonate synthase class II [Candidatus Neomarinimicrobiota bacterium]|tara:strand:+ start:35 stop:1381 length:1347 start_codon:yes stop_codon:yes gene_type:complete
MMWQLDSWKKYKAKHIPDYKDPEHLNRVLETLKGFPPLVFAGEVRSLSNSLAEVAEGNGFLLQGGDCAESFSEFHADNIRDTFRVILQMAIILTSGTNLPIVKVGRMAGQFAKPRSSPTEQKNGQELESYKGDIINGIEFDETVRKPDPDRMLKAYSQAASTLNLLRAFADGGYADLRFVNSWNMGFLKSGSEYERYRKLANKIQESLNFMDALGVTTDNTPQLRKTDYYTCHEALLIPYEEALTRVDSTSGDIYDTSAHFVWIGDRTRFENSAHVEFCKGIKNPIGIKCGPSTDHDDLIKIIDKINPDNTAGRITLIARYGNDKVDNLLPKLIKRITDEGRIVVWSCDPMHGNTIKSSNGTKTRPFDKILSEVKKNIQLHNSLGSWFGGIHLEMTGQNVTECTGGIEEISESDLKDRYHTHCDPRLNANQAIELAFLIADELKNNGN